MRRLPTLATLPALLTACEDAGDPGDDNLVTGASLVAIVIIIIVIVLVRRRG
jgi:ABC-type glycerol-3-phosphate transport system permease component